MIERKRPDEEGDQLSDEEKERIRDSAMDKTLADSFPASDPPSTIPNPEDRTASNSRAKEDISGSLEDDE